MRRVVVLALVVLAVATAGCQQAADKVAQKAVEAATGVQVDQKGDQVTIKGKDGESITVGSQVPDELKNFPVPQGFKLSKDGFGSMSSKGDTVSVGSWEGTGTPASVVEFYQKTMPGQGWTEDFVMNDATGGQASYTKGQSQAVVTVDKKDNVTGISVLFGKSTQAKPASDSGALGVSVPAGAAPTVPPAAATKPAAAATPAAVATKPAMGTAVTSAAGTSATAVPTKAAAAAATPTPEGPKLTDASALPVELKSLPVPTGFGLVAGSTKRSTSGGKFDYAEAKWFGKSTVKEVAKFYQSQMAKDWDEDSFDEGENTMEAYYYNKKDPDLELIINVFTEDGGLFVHTWLKQG